MDSKVEKRLRKLFRQEHVLNMKQLMTTVEAKSSRTVFRYLEQLNYISSYTHTRSYYTLPEIAKFDQDGFWHYGVIGFSLHGNLKDTLLYLINTSEAGRTHSELELLQHCRAHNALRELVRDKKLKRESVDGVFVYTTADSKQSGKQLNHRGKFPKGTPPEHSIIDVLLASLMVLQSAGQLSVLLVVQKLKERRSTITESEVGWVFEKYELEKKILDSFS